MKPSPAAPLGDGADGVLLKSPPPLAFLLSANSTFSATTSVVYTRCPSDVPAHIEQDVRIMDNVLRFLCVRKDEQ